VEDLIEAAMHRWKIPGLSLAVVRDGDLHCATGFGLADRERAKPASEETTYAIASVTKTFVAAAIMMLVEDGALELDRSITDFVADLPAEWQPITIRQLLAHTSGIKDYFAYAGFWYDTPATAKERIDAVARLPLRFPPGSRWEYSNTGYLLLGEVISRVSGRTYDRFLWERVFGPIGMNRTRINDPDEADANRAIGYHRRFDWRRLRMSLVLVDLPEHRGVGRWRAGQHGDRPRGMGHRAGRRPGAQAGKLAAVVDADQVAFRRRIAVRTGLGRKRN
jgi:CubicO group peptidase (beta-lactamase class C family)